MKELKTITQLIDYTKLKTFEILVVDDGENHQRITMQDNETLSQFRERVDALVSS